MKYKRKYKKGGKFKYQTGGHPDPPTPLSDLWTNVFGPANRAITGARQGFKPNHALFGQFKENVATPVVNAAGRQGPTGAYNFGFDSGPAPSGQVETPVTQTNEGLLPNYSPNFPVIGEQVQGSPASLTPEPGPWRRELDPLGLVRMRGAGTPDPSPTEVEASPASPGPSATGPNVPREGGVETANLPNNFEVPQGELAMAGTPEFEGAAEASVVPPGEAGGGLGSDLLQFAPDIMNFATGVFGKDETKPATRVSRKGVGMIDDRVNVRPQLMAARRNYRAIIADPNASANQKLAAQAQLNAQESKIYADKFNRETQLATNKASLQSQLDTQQSQYDEQYRQDKMQSEANLGITGNFAREALGNISTKMLQKKAEDAKRTGDKRDILAYISSLPEAAQTRILENYDLN